jgi:hypothetical protein
VPFAYPPGQFRLRACELCLIIWSHDFWSFWDFVSSGSGTQSHQVLLFPGRPVASSSGFSQVPDSLLLCFFRWHHHYNNNSGSTAVLLLSCCGRRRTLEKLVVCYGGVLGRLRSGTYQDLGGTRWIVVATHSLVLQFGHKLAFQGVHLVGV